MANFRLTGSYSRFFAVSLWEARAMVKFFVSKMC